MKIQNGTTYENNYARAAAGFLGTCAQPPEEPKQKAAYDCITGIYRAIMRDASAIGWKTLPDVSFAPWEQQKGREKDIKSIRDPIAKIEVLIQALFDAVEAGEACPDGLLIAEDAMAPAKPLVKALAAAGYETKREARIKICMPDGCADALKALAAISRAHTVPITDGPKEDKAYLFFSRVVFRPEENWAAQALDGVLNADGRLIALCDALEARGYRRVDCRDGKRVSVDYVKQHGKKDEPLKASWGERTHSGIEVSFEELRLAPCFLWVRMPMFKTVLACIDRLPAGVQGFIAAHTKTCDGCRYCVQTDKTGTRPLAAVLIGEEYKCPLYPGFTMNWRQLSEALSENILALLDAVDALTELQ